MPWSTPKTDWSESDGVRDSDFNRIEGNILELYNTAKVRSTAAINVSPSGNDTLGNGTSASPYATFARALRDVPNDLDGTNVVINVAYGSYNEEVYINNFYNGVINIVMNSSASIKGLTINSAHVVITGTTLTITSTSTGVLIVGQGYLKSDARIELSGGANGIYVDERSSIVTSAAVVVYDASVRAITVKNGSFAYLSIVAGSGNAAGALISDGSTFAYNNFTLLVGVNGTLLATETGGRIYTGSQSNNSLATTEVV